MTLNNNTANTQEVQVYKHDPYKGYEYYSTYKLAPGENITVSGTVDMPLIFRIRTYTQDCRLETKIEYVHMESNVSGILAKCKSKIYYPGEPVFPW
jgi:hypothetical protein